jgi:phage gp29-like protein
MSRRMLKKAERWSIISPRASMPEARQNNSKLAEMLARASNFRALVGMAVDVVDLFMALLSFVESAPRAYRLKASNE